MSKLFLFCWMTCFVQASASDPMMVCDYYSMLEAMPDVPELYSDEMASDPIGCGITRIENEMSSDYKMVAGMEDQPMKGVTPWQQAYYEHWVAEGRPQAKEIASPLMMFGEHKKGAQEEGKNGLKQQFQEAICNREMTHASHSESPSSSSQQRDVGMPKTREIMEGQPPTLKMTFGNLDADEIRAVSEATTTQENTPQSSFTPRNTQECHHQAQKALTAAAEQSKAAAKHLDETLKQWEISINLEREKQRHPQLQQQLSSAWIVCQNSIAAFNEAEAALHNTVQNVSPFSLLAVAHAETMHNSFQTYQALVLQAEAAFVRYMNLQQAAIARGVIEGVNYGNLLLTAQRRANEADKNLKKCKAEWIRINPKKPNISFQKLPSIGKDPLSSSKESDGLAFSRPKTTYQDQETHISKEDLETLESQALLKKTLEEILLEESTKEIQETVEQTLQEKKILVAQQHVAAVSEKGTMLQSMKGQITAKQKQEDESVHIQINHVLEDTTPHLALLHLITESLIDDVLSKDYFKKLTKEAKKAIKKERVIEAEKIFLSKKQRFFAELFPPRGETTQSEKRALEEASINSRKQAKKAYRAEMKHFCTERVDLLHRLKKEEPAPTLMKAIVPIVENSRNFLTQSWRSFYEWGSHTFQFLQDAQERAAQQEAARSENIPPALRDPSEELGFFEKIPLFFDGSIFERALDPFFNKHFYSPTRECNERAKDYFEEIGKIPNPLEFWQKATEIQKQIDQEKLEKAKEFFSQYPDDRAERLRIAVAWGKAWPERLQQEREQKKRARLEQAACEQQRLAQEKVAAEIAAKEAVCQKIAQELIEQEQKEKQKKQKPKSKSSSKKN